MWIGFDFCTPLIIKPKYTCLLLKPRIKIDFIIVNIVTYINGLILLFFCFVFKPVYKINLRLDEEKMKNAQNVSHFMKLLK